MDEKKLVSTSTKKVITTTKFKQKDWVKKLEKISGESIHSIKYVGTVYLVIDCSGSMSEGNKMIQAKRGSVGFAYEAQSRGYSIGLIQFSSLIEHILEPQDDLTNFNANVENMIADGSTNMADAIHEAMNRLIDKVGEKVICIVTDGLPDDTKAALNAAKEARKEGVDLMTIGTDDADYSFLKKLSTRNELSLKVDRDQLEHGIVSMARMLPGKNA